MKELRDLKHLTMLVLIKVSRQVQCDPPRLISSVRAEAAHNPSLAAALEVHSRELFIDNLLVRIHFIIVMIRWTGLAPWEFEFPCTGLSNVP